MTGMTHETQTWAAGGLFPSKALPQIHGGPIFTDGGVEATLLIRGAGAALFQRLPPDARNPSKTKVLPVEAF